MIPGFHRAEPLDAALTHSQDFNSLDELYSERLDEMFAPLTDGGELGRGGWEEGRVNTRAGASVLPSRPTPLSANRDERGPHAAHS